VNIDQLKGQMMKWDIQKIREDFPCLHQIIRGENPLIYFDTASSAQKPKVVLESMNRFYQRDYSNVHRGVHALSERASTVYESVRHVVQGFIHAASEKEIIFTKGTTDSLNLLAHSFCKAFMKPGDEVLLSTMEHHANIVPWQLAKEMFGIEIRVIPITLAGELDLVAYESLLSEKTKLVSICHASNVLGTVNPVEKMIEMAHAKGIPVALDGAQFAVHQRVDVQALNCDFYSFSSHKLYGPTGVGVLYGKRKWLEKMPPYQGGGDMIRSVSFDKTSFAFPPERFEAGTPNIAGVVGLAAAIEYLEKIGIDKIHAYEQDLLRYATETLKEVPGLRMIGEAKEKAPLISFLFEDIHAHDVGTILDHEGIASRAGHHCAMPLMKFFGVPATVRVSFGFYNTHAEIDVLGQALHKLKRVFG
jgi:cysteine desulfurase/selenocysteine lyase